MRKIFYERSLSMQPLPEAWQVDPKGRFVWLQRLAAALLKRWGQPVLMAIDVAKEIIIPTPESLIEQIREELRARVSFNEIRHEDLVLVVGLQAHHDLIIEYSGMLEYNWRRSSEVFGMPVFVSAWFEGWIVLPRTAVLRNQREHAA